MMQFQPAIEFISDKLKRELPAYLTYHSYDHIIDVYQAAENLGKLENITDHEMQLLLTAALFHDSGFIEGAANHEECSCRIAEKYLPAFEFTHDDIKTISGMIMATRLPQTPKNLLEEILADADLDYLGRDDFFRISNLLYNEFIYAGVVKNINEWNKLQVSFFESHHYFTNAALKLRQDKKQAHLEILKSK
ncbi:HD domain-containing protein [Mucilaginibacter sp.]|uniref:HD domain-containing protein n=1 Tax=Mucilaginibacter sp. TaxID=1882438 RepID=UPI00284FD7A7|nr:HD domain-containing protein [Mucilaginibacter sp.]MDR3694642.1 HD domain-containing protein [Mucilaginibacter sp.]